MTDEYPGLGRKTDRPRPNRAVDLARLPLTPAEYFVFTRVDGVTSYQDICVLTGLGVDATLDILRKLRRERLILLPGEDSAPVPAAAARPEPAAAAPPAGAAAAVSLLERLDDGSLVDAAALAAGPDLDPETKARILRLHRRLKTLAAHELLGVAPDAEPAVVKKAYFKASKELHPDRHFGRDIGPFRERLSEIFARLTQAFETLQKR